jgi:ElaB/YqjD/DUF883 family membrane-anchored ribosome-binding protein
MSANPLHSPGDIEKGPDEEAIDRAQKALKASVNAAEQRLTEAVKAAERVVREGVESLWAQARAYSGPTSRTVDEAQRYVVERVKDRPVTATLAGLGVGMLIGFLLSNRGK